MMSLYACKTSKNNSQSTEYNSQMNIKSTLYPSTNFMGSVKDIQSNEAIPFVKVVLTNEKGVYNGTITDEAGNFSIKNLPLGVYRLRISALGYKDIENVFDVKRNTNFQLDVKLSIHVNEVEKPVIYLYPTVKQNVQVKLNYEGTLTHTYPKYPINGWQVIAEPNGTLWDENGLEYYALFWEGKPNVQIIPTDGFIVSGEETAYFLEEKLAYLGLNRREANEFMMYWLPRMENNPYNFIHFASKQYEEQAALNINPKPESIIRVMMLTQPLSSKINFPLQDLSSLKKTRKGFTVVEWGGSVIDTIIEEI
jgi:hypothetical protein